ncbi:hypothetical protein TNCT_331351 [Trichonephila clavata]|uniref:Uncharacterized protein n=1 Tax=Trichonephila clavata TaxID=2740835 RepID=A0A8X6HTW1_TRICU|nr:hypothetical protein TNCT_331351 [Trichonephila clavata]
MKNRGRWDVQMVKMVFYYGRIFEANQRKMCRRWSVASVMERVFKSEKNKWVEDGLVSGEETFSAFLGGFLGTGDGHGVETELVIGF